MKILMLVIKNTAALDFALPLLWKIRERHPQGEVAVLFCIFSRYKILRQSHFYSQKLAEWNIRQLDFADFLPAPWSFLRRLWRRACSRSDRDSSPWERRLGGVPGGKQALSLGRRGTAWLEGKLIRKIDYSRVLPLLSPDIVLFDNTTRSSFFGRDYFYRYFATVKKKVIMLPHAPHHATTTAFTPFDENGEALPEYCEFWMPFKFARAWVNMPDQKSQFAYVGYPGLDTSWLERFKPAPNSHHGPLRLLFVIRRFLPEGQVRGSDVDTFIYDYAEFTRLLGIVSSAIKTTTADIELIVKPHPSNDFQSLKQVFARSGIPRWRIAQDSVYALLPVCDAVISLYSTILLITAMAGIPTIVLNSRIQEAVHQEEVMGRMYGGLRYYLEEPTDLESRLPELIKAAYERRRSGTVPSTDIEHLRRFYPDGAMQLCLDRLGL
jgi:hypothetical protein